MISVPSLHRSGVLALLVLLVTAPLAQAQDMSGSNQQSVPFQLMQRQQMLPDAPTGDLALEGAVDPDEYVIGPGDKLLVSIGGAMPLEEEVLVSADGTVALPDVGAISAAGQSLEAVESAALEQLRDKYAHVPVSVSLVGLRHFYVHIAGAVPQPGRYAVTPIARVDDAIQRAYAAMQQAKQNPENQDELYLPGSAVSQRPSLNSAYRPALRNIKLVRKDGTVQRVDLMRYYLTGDPQFNPYLRDGDRLSVPTFHINRGAVVITGDVPYAGRFSYREGDTVQDLLLLASGPNLYEDIDQARLVRRGSDKAVTEIIDVDAVQSGRAEPTLLEPGDLIDVIQREEATAAIYGFVEYPGTYPIVAGETTLQELVEMAGGLQPDANPAVAYIERRKSEQFKSVSRASELDFFGRTYLKSELNHNHVVIDLEKLLQPGAEPFYLNDRDAVIFPKDEGTIFVTGNVPKPGYQQYEPGKPASYYIAQAGGQGPLSTGVYVIEGTTGETREGINTIVRTGETVFINRTDFAENPEIAQMALTDESARRQANIARTQIIISSLTAAVGILATLDRFGLFD